MADPLFRARFARQILVAGIGDVGQDRIARATARVPRDGLAGAVAGAYVARAGFAAIEDGPREEVPSFVVTPAAREVLAGSLSALRAIVAAAIEDGD